MQTTIKTNNPEITEDHNQTPKLEKKLKIENKKF